MCFKRLTFFILHSTVIVFLIFAEVQIAPASEAPALLLKKIVERFDGIVNYSAVITTTAGKTKNIMHYFYEKPGYAKMIFISPHKGAEITYNPVTGKALLQPFKRMPLVSLTLSPYNGLITSPQGHTIDKSDMGYLIEVMTALSKNGTIRVISDFKNNSVNNINLEIEGNDGFSINKVNRYNIKFDTALYFPIAVIAYSTGGEIIENMELADLKIDYDFPVGTFDF